MFADYCLITVSVTVHVYLNAQFTLFTKLIKKFNYTVGTCMNQRRICIHKKRETIASVFFVTIL